jgi:hypothetical protein
MDDDTSAATVYFACPKCSLLYKATQKRRSEQVSGSIDCLKCKRPVHQWSGFYDFIGWRPVRPERRNGREH